MEKAKAVEYQGSVKATRMVTSDVREVIFTVKGSEAVPFLPGQFLNLKVPRSDKPRPYLRSYSIVNQPGTQDLAILVDTDPQGPGSQFLNAMKPGQSIAFKAPLGLFHLRDPSEKRALIAANVSAVGVCHALAKAILERQPERQVTFLFQPKKESELFWHQKLLTLSRTYPNFHHVITVEDPSPQWAGPTGKLIDHLSPYLGEPENIEAYLAGLGDVVNSLRDRLMEAGVPKGEIKVERFSTATKKKA